MFDTGRLSDELKATKFDVASLLSAAAEQTFNTSKNHAETLAKQIKATLAELDEGLSEEQVRLHDLVAGRPVASLASAFALGVAIGFMLRRH